MSKEEILIVDDSATDLQLLKSILIECDYHVYAVATGQAALEAARATRPDLILLDVDMPDIDGYEVCSALTSELELADIPIIFVSALDQTLDKVKAFNSGGVDYITKPYEFPEVLARVEAHLEIYRQQREIEQLREADRLYFEMLSQMKDDLLNIVSHDLKNPLANIVTAAALLEQYGSLEDEDGQRCLAIIERGASRMASLIADLLDIAGLETGLALNMEWHSVNGLLDYACASWGDVAQEKGITLRIVLLVEDIIAWFDQARMDQVLQNLISNAIKYTPHDGYVEIAAFAEVDSVVISVADSGLGIPASAIPHLFDKFYRVPGKHQVRIEGSGLGLSIVKTIIEQHSGSIWVDSEPGSGSIFSVRLPLLYT